MLKLIPFDFRRVLRSKEIGCLELVIKCAVFYFVP